MPVINIAKCPMIKNNPLQRRVPLDWSVRVDCGIRKIQLVNTVKSEIETYLGIAQEDKDGNYELTMVGKRKFKKLGLALTDDMYFDHNYRRGICKVKHIDTNDVIATIPLGTTDREVQYKVEGSLLKIAKSVFYNEKGAIRSPNSIRVTLHSNVLDMDITYRIYVPPSK